MCRGRDVCKDAQNDGSTARINYPPDHGRNTHRSVGFYAERAPPGTPISEILAAWNADVDPAERWPPDSDTADAEDLPDVGTRVVDCDASPTGSILVVVDHLEDLETGAPAVAVVPEDTLAESLRGSRDRRPRSWQSVPELASAVEHADGLDARELAPERVEVADAE